MKHVIAAFLLFHALHAFAWEVPDETSTQGLPYAIPCTWKVLGGENFMSCMWNPIVRNVTIWNKEQQRDVEYRNLVNGQCIKSVCKAGSSIYGNWGRPTSFSVQIWYYIAESSDGYPVAYLTGTGPSYGGPDVTYLDAANMLHTFYKNMGLNQQTMTGWMNDRFIGGYAAFLKAAKPTPVSVNTLRPGTVIKEAHCSQDMDDECYLDNKKVSKADLHNYLPVVDVETVKSDGGYCEYPICYNSDDKPIGITR